MFSEDVIYAVLEDSDVSLRFYLAEVMSAFNKLEARIDKIETQTEPVTAWGRSVEARIVELSSRIDTMRRHVHIPTSEEQASYPDQENREAGAPKEETYPCATPGCENVRTKAEGGTVFSVCDECWDKAHPPKEREEYLKVRVRDGDVYADVASTSHDQGWLFHTDHLNNPADLVESPPERVNADSLRCLRSVAECGEPMLYGSAPKEARRVESAILELHTRIKESEAEAAKWKGLVKEFVNTIPAHAAPFGSRVGYLLLRDKAKAALDEDKT